MSIANTFIAGPPEVLPDPRLVPAPYRGPGAPTLYSWDLVEQFCDLIIEGMTVRVACQRTGMPGQSTIYEWLARYPEFRRRYESAVLFRNQCWMDDCVDIADQTAIVHKEGETINDRKLRIDTRMRQLNGMGLKKSK